MKKLIIALSVVFGIIIFAVGMVVVTYISTTNTEISKRENVNGKQKVCMTFSDKMFKEIQEVAQVADAAKESFKEIYPDLIKGRYNNARGGALMSWVTESNPNFDLKLYDKLADVIKVNRDEFQIHQEQLIDLKRDYDTYISTFPNRLFLSSAKPIDIVIITSDATEEAYRTGKQETINVFNKKTKNNDSI